MSSPPVARPRPRDLGVVIGRLPPGPTDSIVDVPDVRVGHQTVWRDEAPPPAGRGVARTGFTAIVPFTASELFSSRVPAGAAVLNGAGEAIGITSIGEWGTLETPIFLTSSMAIGRIYDGAVAALVDLDERAGVEATEAAVIGSLFRADTVEGRDGHVVPALPVERTLEWLAAAGRLAS